MFNSGEKCISYMSRPPVFSHNYHTLSFPKPFLQELSSLKISLSEESFQDVSVSVTHILSDVVEEKRGLGTERLNFIYEKSQLAEKDWKPFFTMLYVIHGACGIRYFSIVGIKYDQN